MTDAFPMNRRILIIDDQESIHHDFNSILAPSGEGATGFNAAAAALLGEETAATAVPEFQLASAYQGKDGFEMARQAIETGAPYAMAFVDMRMPPGWNGLETIRRLWDVDAELQVVICTAYSDYSWDQTIEQLGHSDRLLILKKPFDNAEISQMACALTEKWNLARQARLRLDELGAMVTDRTQGLESANQQLKLQITERERVERALQRTLASAEAGTRAKSEFLANMSHEIRTPMTAILGYADLLMVDEEVAQDPVRRLDALHTIRRNGNHLLDLVNDILDLSKIEAGKLEIERLACSPWQIVSEVESLMAARAREKGLELKSECVTAFPETITTDPTRLRQILLNLVGNAVKFTEQGEVRIVARLVERDAPEPAMQFDVIDTGIGMTTEQAAGLFQPFSQADASTTRQFGGSGLGLNISQQLAEMLGGRIVIADTQQGVGTTFRATVATGPLDAVRMIEKPERWNMVPPGAIEDTPDAPVLRLDGCRLLLAEDNPTNRVLVAGILKKTGATVTTVENGRLAADAALAACERGEAFDVLLMDMQMPVMDGYEATELLRAKGYTGPIIALTAHAMEGASDKCLKAGCDAYAGKPIDRKQLITTIHAHLAAERVA